MRQTLADQFAQFVHRQRAIDQQRTVRAFDHQRVNSGSRRIAAGRAPRPSRSFTVTMPVTSPYSSTSPVPTIAALRGRFPLASAHGWIRTQTAPESRVVNKVSSRSCSQSGNDFTSSKPSTSASLPLIDHPPPVGRFRRFSQVVQKRRVASMRTCGYAGHVTRPVRSLNALHAASCCSSMRRRSYTPARGHR